MVVGQLEIERGSVPIVLEMWKGVTQESARIEVELGALLRSGLEHEDQEGELWQLPQ